MGTIPFQELTDVEKETLAIEFAENNGDEIDDHYSSFDMEPDEDGSQF